jgi:hypothetical protein
MSKQEDVVCEVEIQFGHLCWAFYTYVLGIGRPKRPEVVPLQCVSWPPD